MKLRKEIIGQTRVTGRPEVCQKKTSHLETISRKRTEEGKPRKDAPLTLI